MRTAMSRVTASRGVVARQAGTPATQSAMVARTEGRGSDEPVDRRASVMVASPVMVIPSFDMSKPKPRSFTNIVRPSRARVAGTGSGLGSASSLVMAQGG